MDGWMNDGRMDGWVDGWMDGWMMEEQMDGWMMEGWWIVFPKPHVPVELGGQNSMFEN